MSGLEIHYLDREDETVKYVVDERLALTEDGRVVPEDDPAARWLYAIPGTEIPMAEAERYGLVKEKPKAEDKQLKPEANKGGSRRKKKE